MRRAGRPGRKSLLQHCWWYPNGCDDVPSLARMPFAFAIETEFVSREGGTGRRLVFVDSEAQLNPSSARDPTTDIALLRSDRVDLPLAPLHTTELAAGSLGLVLGAEDGRPTAALGIVSRSGGAWRSMRGGEIDARIELDVSLRRRAEGGLVLSAAGRAIGMAVFGPRRRVLVIPAATIERVAAKLETHGRIARGYLGLGFQTVAIEGGEESGMMVMSVDPQGPGATAGIQQGDILVAWNGESIRHVQSLLSRARA